MLIARLFLLALLFFGMAGMAACGGGAKFGADKPQDQTRDDKSESEKTSGDSEQADEPAMVSGSFLTCARTGEATGETVGIGCAATIDNQKLASSCGFTLKLEDDDHSTIPMNTRNAAADSAWHMLADLPKKFLTTPAWLRLTAHCRDKTVSQRTTDLSDQADLGKSAGSEGQGNNDSVLNLVPVQRFWDAKELGTLTVFGNGIAVEDFCVNGKAAPSIRGKSRELLEGMQQSGFLGAIVTLFAGDLETKESSIVWNTSGPPARGQCFKSFDRVTINNGLPSRQDDVQFAHASADGCLYTQIGDLIYISEQDPESGLTLSNLRRYAAKYGCQ